MKIRHHVLLNIMFMVLAEVSLANVFSVINSGFSDYVINGVADPSLTLYRGRAYVFNINASGHPFWIKTNAVTGTGSAYTNGVTGNGTDVGTLTFVVPTNAPNTLYYICQFHSTMVGTLDIKDSPQRGWWRFELPGAVVHDYSGWSYHGVITNMNTGFDDGESGFSTDVPGSQIIHETHTNQNWYSLRFRKNGGRVSILVPERFDLTNNPATFTIEAFIKINRPLYPMRIFDARLIGLPEPPPRTTISAFFSVFTPAPLMGLSLHSDLTTNYVTFFASAAVNPSPFAPGHWHHMAYVVTSTNIFFYADYQLISSADTTMSDYVPGPFTNINEVTLGTIAGQQFNNFDGWLDEVRITDRALAPSEFLRVAGGLVPGIRAYTSPESPATFTIITEAGSHYQLQGTTNLLAAPQVWTNVSAVVTGNAFYTTVSLSGSPAKFYRVIKNP